MAITFRPVLRFQEAGRTYYTGWMSAADVYDAVFVPVAKKTKLPKRLGKHYVEPLEEREGGYQRSANRGRQGKIAEYFIENSQAVIPPVLLSDRGAWKWIEREGLPIGDLVATEKAAVVDGQHRLGGFRLQATMAEGQPDRRIQFVVASGLSPAEEQKEFLTINNTQKGVPKAHTAFLESDKWWNAAAIEIGDEGPFMGRIQGVGGSKEPWQLDLKLHSVANAIRDCFAPSKKTGDVWGFDDDEERKDEIPSILNRYWELISETFADEWSDIEKLPYPVGIGSGGGEGTPRDFEYKLLELTGFIAFMWFLEGIALRVWNSQKKTLNETELIRYLTWIREASEQNPEYGRREGEPETRKVVDWRKKGKFEGRTGGAGARPIFEAMRSVIQSRTGDET